MHPSLAATLAEWRLVRGKTLEFLETMPEDLMAWRPGGNELLGTFGMQLRHLGKSQEAYLIGIKTGAITFSDKQFDPAIETDKRAALAYLERLDADMLAVLESIETSDVEILFKGSGEEKKISLTTVLWYLIEHEVYHHGIFTCYGRMAGLGKFTFM